VIARSNLNAKQKQKAMFALGQDFFAAGMLDRAESVFQELQGSNSKWISKAAISESLRTIYEQTHEWQKAIDATLLTKKYQKKDLPESNVNANSLISHYYCELADEALLKGNLHEVDGFVSKALKINKQSTRLMSLQGDVALHQKQYKYALKHYLKAIQQDSRLLNVLLSKMQDAAEESGSIPNLQSDLLSVYQLKKDKNVFEAILFLADKHGTKESIDDLVEDALTKEKLSISSIHKASEFVKNDDTSSKSSLGVEKIHQSLANHLQGVPTFRCEHCGYKMHDYLWRCPACNQWDTVDHA